MNNEAQLLSKNTSNARMISNIVLFLTGKLVSLLGTSIYSFAIGLYVLKITGSGTNFALTIVIGMLPRIILGPFAGAIADRANRKFMVVSMDILSGLLLIGVYFLSISNGLTLTYIYISTFLLTILNTFFAVAFDAAIPNIVDDDRLMKINSLNQTILSLTQILGPVLGGLIFGIIDIRYFVLFNGISFIISGISETFINFDINNTRELSKEDGNEKTSIFSDTIEGFKYIKSKKVIYSLMKYTIFINFFFSAVFVVMPYITVNELSLSSSQFGIIQGAFALGSLILSIVLSTLPEIKSKHKLLSTSFVLLGIMMLLIGIPTSGLVPFMSNTFYFIYFIIINLSIGSILVLINLPIMISLQRETPDEFRGRVFGVITTVSMSITPIAIIINGILIDIIPSFAIPAISGILFLLVVISFRRNKYLKNL